MKVGKTSEILEIDYRIIILREGLIEEITNYG